MDRLVEWLGWLTTAMFAFVALLCVVLWRRSGGRATGWLAGAFGVLGGGSLVGAVVPETIAGATAFWEGKLLVLAFLLFPYLLCRFAASLERVPRSADMLGHALTAVVVVAVLLIPHLPAAGERYTGWLLALAAVVAVQWTLLSSIVAVRLWRAGKGQPNAVKYRVRLMSVASAGLNAAILISVTITQGSASLQVVSALVTLASAMTFFVAIAPPASLREAWRRPAQVALRRAMGDFMSANEAEHVAAFLLPHLTSIVAGSGAALFDSDRNVVLTHGVTVESAMAAAAALDAGDARAHGTIVHLDLTSGSILVWTSPYAPVFGRQDLEMLHSLGALADVALQRIASRKAAEIEQRRLELFLASVVDNLPSMVVVKRASDLTYVEFNRAAEELLGYPRERFIGKSDHDLLPEAEAEASASRDREALRSPGVVDIPEETVPTRANGERVVHTKMIPLLGATEEPEFLLAISYDITDAKAAAEALARARTEADRANRAKSEFLSRMSHELRTPLNAVLGFAQLLELDVAPDLRPSVAQIRRAGVHLLDLINEVLDISRIESGQLALSPEPVLVSEVVEEALDLIRPLADSRGLELTLEPASSLGRHIVADRQRIKQVLLNLLSNAVKYNRPGGSIRVSCSEVQGPGGPTISITFTDTGVGIDEADLDRLFVPFDRLGAEQTDVEGTGVGLALSLRLVEAMGGRLTVESTRGRGSAFTVSLAAAPEPASQVAAGQDPVTDDDSHDTQDDTPRFTVLCIEDNSSNVRLVEQVIARRTGWQIIHARQGDVGLELATSWASGPGLDLVLLDLHLPDMHGYDVLRQLRSQPSTSDVPVVTLSADATPGQIKRLLAAGADRYLTKPFNVAELLGILDRISVGDRPVEVSDDSLQV
ncbi:MAG: two-component system sensor protein [Frankiales bacterium]|nr:two-component system sensor protein [Frankiales bacterium]